MKQGISRFSYDTTINKFVHDDYGNWVQYSDHITEVNKSKDEYYLEGYEEARAIFEQSLYGLLVAANAIETKEVQDNDMMTMGTKTRLMTCIDGEAVLRAIVKNVQNSIFKDYDTLMYKMSDRTVVLESVKALHEFKEGDK